MTKPAVPPFDPGPVAGRRDWFGRDGAQVLADEIELRWRQLGHTTVEVWVEPMDVHGGGYMVRSNLVGGMPPGRSG